MFNIRPHQVFHMVKPEDRKITVQLPTSRTALSALETFILMALFKAIKPQKVFEFGTYLGETTLTWAYNLEGNDSKIYTLDLPAVQGVEFQGRDEWCADIATSNHKYFEGKDEADGIIQIWGDSLYFEPAELLNSIQYIFIDGNHMKKYAAKDTENAITMLDKTVPSCVIWHDYGNPEHPELTKYLDELSAQYDIYHVQATMLAFYLNKCNIAPTAFDQ
ncbi:MAG: class I SAM-dependent methyltransferase [Syntrophomonas sp.]|nr:class I SAM-dependent methyltransferase [Syntrophomonas sp.]